MLQQLQDVREDSDYLAMLLRNREKCRQEGVYFLNIASRLLQAGFRLSFIRGRQDQKLPDIKVTDFETDESFYIEVTHLEKNEAFKRDENNFRIIGEFNPLILIENAHAFHCQF